MPVFIVFLCRKRFFNTTYFGKKPFVSLCKNFSKKFSENLLTIYYSYDIFIKRSSREHAGVAQLVEQLICNQQVGGSSPSTSSIFIYGRIPERPKGADCKSVVNDFGGSNPPSPTKKQTSKSLSVFLSIAKAMAYHQGRLVALVSHQSVRTVYHHALACIKKAFAMMICNSLRN